MEPYPTILHHIANGSTPTECLDIILEYSPLEVLTYLGQVEEYPYVEKGTAFHVAIESRSEDCVYKLLRKGKSFNVDLRLIEDQDGLTPLAVLLAYPMGEKWSKRIEYMENHGVDSKGDHDPIARAQSDHRLFSTLIKDIGWRKAMGNCRDETVWKNIIPFFTDIWPDACANILYTLDNEEYNVHIWAHDRTVKNTMIWVKQY
eukprot:TRINITY_DN126706_c0_g2_i1.p1 TRINITY_DN126706_c0_g2~~TRINITY_DN126706_c0_g2_i1.p1  ORF type:complete len:203 (+),score=29.74 TRINITY_DN126706_c0_g2_i1:159-767(+)